MTPRYRLRPYARRGWSKRYAGLWLWVRDGAGLVGLIAVILGIGFFATWTGQ